MLVRRDLLEKYCERTSQNFGWVFWGERDILAERFDDVPAWFGDAVRSGANEHLLVSDLAGLAADRPQIAATCVSSNATADRDSSRHLQACESARH